MTRDVKARTPEDIVENALVVNYNQRVSSTRILACFAVALSVALGAVAACEKKPNKSDTGAISAADRASGSAPGGSSTTPPGPVDTSPLKGVDVKLDGDKATLFYKLIGSLTSPCQKPESLRKSFTDDSSCKRAPFAIRYVMAMIDDEATEDKIRELYEKKYGADAKVAKIDTMKAPRVGNDDAPVKLVEFFDYECPHCRNFKPILDKVEADNEGKVVTYYMMYPIHKDSRAAAQAALAAQAQGKFRAMHDLLFTSEQHPHEVLVEMAKQVGLDMTKFEADFEKFGPVVDAQHDMGKSNGVDSTPTLFFNDRKYEGPLNPKYIGLWIDEELAVNR